MEAISRLSAPENRQDVMCFLRMAGYYKKYCPNSAHIAMPLTNLLKKMSNSRGVQNVKMRLIKSKLC